MFTATTTSFLHTVVVWCASECFGRFLESLKFLSHDPDGLWKEILWRVGARALDADWKGKSVNR